jgi:hypothetical protein
VAQAIRMPPETELPKGALRDFVEELFRLYRAARRPTLREISNAIRMRDDLRGSASTETIRRMLRGSVPAHWVTVEAVLVGLCDLAGEDPDAPYEGSMERGDSTRRQDLEYAWHRALDEPPRARGGFRIADDPWAETGREGFGSSLGTSAGRVQYDPIQPSS